MRAGTTTDREGVGDYFDENVRDLTGGIAFRVTLGTT